MEKIPKKRGKGRVVGGSDKSFGSRSMGDTIVESENKCHVSWYKATEEV